MKFTVALCSKLDGKVWSFVEHNALTAQIEADYVVAFGAFELVSITQKNNEE